MKNGCSTVYLKKKMNWKFGCWCQMTNKQTSKLRQANQTKQKQVNKLTKKNTYIQNTYSIQSKGIFDHITNAKHHIIHCMIWMKTESVTNTQHTKWQSKSPKRELIFDTITHSLHQWVTIVICKWNINNRKTKQYTKSQTKQYKYMHLL